MCGACCRAVATDEWSPLVATLRDRWEATRVVNAVLAACAHPARVVCLSGGWTVRASTGATLLAESLTDVWQHCLTAGAIPQETLRTLEVSARSPVACAVHAAAASVVPQTIRRPSGRSRP
jgi:hypothetical protein